jgi:hypothetical protein
MPNAVNSAVDADAVSAEFASSSSRFSTMDGRYALSAASKNAVSTAVNAATAKTCHSARVPSMKVSGMESSNSARPRSAQMRTGLRRRRSTQAPATRATPRPAISSSDRRAETSIGPALRTRIATNGSARRVTIEPKIEIVAAVQSRTNAGLRQIDDENGCGTGAG